MQILILLGQWLFGRLPFCSLVGALVGVVAGGFLGLTLPAIAPAMLPPLMVLEAGLVLAVGGWIAVIVVFGVWLRYGVAQIWAPAAVNAVLTAVLTVEVNNIVRLPVLAALIGLLVGVLVGLILCRFCPQPDKASAR